LYSYVGGNPVSLADPDGDIGQIILFAGFDLAIQLAMNGGKFQCVDWVEVGLSGVGGGLIDSIFKRAFAALAARTAAARLTNVLEMTGPALPQALTQGRNAETGIEVYYGIRDGRYVYCGVSCNLERRIGEHRGRFEALEQLTTSPVTRGEARAI